MNKFTKIFAFILLTASYTATTFPMNRLARAMATKAPKFAPKITPTLAAQQRRLLSAVPKTASLPNPSLRQRYDVTLQPKFDDHGKQRTFARPYSWLPALGAAAALGLNMQQEKAECLAVGYSIYFLNKSTILIVIPDCHDDVKHLALALDHAKQMKKILDFSKSLAHCNVFVNIEHNINNDNKFALGSYRIAQHKCAGRARGMMTFTDYTPSLTMGAVAGRALLRKMKEGNISYHPFDIRSNSTNYGLEAHWDMLAHLPTEKQQQLSQEYYNKAQNIVQQAHGSKAEHRAVEKYYQDSGLDGYDNSLFGKFKACFFAREQEMLSKDKCIDLDNLPTDATLLCNITQQAKTSGTNIIFVSTGLNHAKATAAMLAYSNIRPAKKTGPVTINEVKNFTDNYNIWREADFFVNDFANPIITELQAWLKQQKLAPAQQVNQPAGK